MKQHCYMDAGEITAAGKYPPCHTMAPRLQQTEFGISCCGFLGKLHESEHATATANISGMVASFSDHEYHVRDYHATCSYSSNYSRVMPCQQHYDRILQSVELLSLFCFPFVVAVAVGATIAVNL